MRVVLCISLFLFLFFSGIAQTIDSIDSLEKQINEASNKNKKISLMLSLAELQYEHDFSSSKKLMNQIFKLLDTTNLKKDQSHLLGKALIIEGIIHRREGKYPKALAYNLKAKEIYRKLNDSSHSADILHNMGMIYRSQKAHNKAIDLYKESIKIKALIKDTLGLASGYNMMGVSFRQSKQLDSALMCYAKAKTLFNTIKSAKNVQRVNNNLAAVFRDQKQYDKALKLNLENIEHSKKLNKIFSLAVAYYNTSTTYKLKKEYQLSLQYVDSSLTLAKQENFRKEISKAYLRRSFLFHKLSDYKKAYFDYRIFNRHSDSIFNVENIKRIQELELTHKFNQEKREIDLITQQEAAEKWFYLLLLIITIVSSCIIGVLVFLNYKNKTKALNEKFEKEQIQKELLDQKIKVNEEETKRLIADNTMRIEFKQELLNKIKTEILPEASKENKEKINSLTSELQKQLQTESKLSDLQNRITSVNKGFDSKLIELYPSLTKTEREVCALLRLNLSIKEIMTVRNASLDSVKSARYRIRKKMQLSPKEELERFIQSL
ncbi:tetratricopeptide repeat protein [Tenacibaculum sp. M341]|uniref:tetratricopeptide repeat protein n=1 Tax=Tenacibaculum sp. M341 TaxID=2530339 RepID=UPI001043CF36|nr:tetratricopeptide repeat protein [Tenacibaculum sp. M341]TCI89982.1 tetratricopeptide repeat protein [Tenacibaculum sp. M341]